MVPDLCNVVAESSRRSKPCEVQASSEFAGDPQVAWVHLAHVAAATDILLVADRLRSEEPPSDWRVPPEESRGVEP